MSRAALMLMIGAGVLAYIAQQQQAQAMQQHDTAAADTGGFNLDEIWQETKNAAGAAMETIGITTRGIRNNNPGNIRHSSIRWQGMSATQTDTAFVQFDTPEYGIRALSTLLSTYNTKYGLNTVRGIINRYAPPSENDTSAYVQAVARDLNVSPDEPISVAGRKAELVQAIIRQENGRQPYSVATINAGVYA